MKRFILMIIFALMIPVVLLSGCTPGEEEEVETTSQEPEFPADAIRPVFLDEEAGVKAKEIPLSDFTFTLPDGYVYGKVENESEGYTTYFVWQDKEDKLYSTALDGDIMLYIYDGLDANSPHKEISKKQALISMKTGYINHLGGLVTLRNRSYDSDVGLSDDEAYFTYTFCGNSGEYFTTTYSDSCYPKTYYGIYTLNAEVDASARRYYGFVFSNDSTGEIFKQSEYETLLEQIKSLFGISTFYCVPTEEYNDFTNGRSYEQLTAPVLYENPQTGYIVRGTFYNSLIYYVETTGRDYERTNVDEPGVIVDTESESESTSVDSTDVTSTPDEGDAP